MKLLHLSIVLFAFSVLLLFVTQKDPSPTTSPYTSNAQELPTPTETVKPTLYAEAPNITAHGIYVFDIASNVVLYQKNSDERVAPASTTKMMTALVASEVYDPDLVVTVPAFKIEGQKMGVFAGENLSIESLLYGTLVDSANDAAEVLARVYPGGRDAFILYMNTKAKALHMDNTTFRNPTGLDDFEHLSTAHDMTLLGEEIMGNPHLRQIVGTTSASVSSVSGKTVHYFKATNELLSTVPGVQGIKTGWTEVAHENLVTYITRDNHPVIIALYGSDDRFGETKKLIDWIYSKTQW